MDVDGNNFTLLGLIATLKQKIKNDDMTRHGVMMVTFSVLAGFFMYLYHLSMGILLEPQQYGALFSLTSLMTIIMVFSQAVSTTVSRFTSLIGANGKLSRVNYLWHFSLKRTAFIGIAAFATLSLLSPLICQFLNLDSVLYPIILFSTMLFLFVYATNQGTLNGLQRFLPLGINLALLSFLTLAFGVLLVFLGASIYGGLTAYPLSHLVVLLLSLFSLRKLPEAGSEPVTISGLGVYAGHALLSVLAVTVLTNIDAVLAKHYLSAADAGNYAAISVLGRVALYAPLGLSTAMFPKTAVLFEKGGNYARVFRKTMLLAFLISGSILLTYGLFSQPIIEFLFGSKYPQAPIYLGTYSLAMALFGFSHITVRYFLSINRTRVSYVLLAVMLLQLTLIVLFHASISQMVNIMLLLSILCLLCQLPFHIMVRGVR